MSRRGTAGAGRGEPGGRESPPQDSRRDKEEDPTRQTRFVRPDDVHWQQLETPHVPLIGDGNPARDPILLTAMREAMIFAVTLDEPAIRDAGPAGAARALRALLPEQTTLSNAEQHLLGEWLDRLTADRQEDC